MKRLSVKLISLSFAIIMALGFTSCGGNRSDSDSELSGTVQIDGSSTVYPITEAVAEEFRKEHPRVETTIGISGTGGGFKKFIRGETDINDASRTVSPSELQQLKDANIDFIELPIAYDGLAVIVHPSNDWVDYLTVEELKKIWQPEAQGKITKWNQIRPEWPNEELHLFGPGVESGTYDYFTEAIVGKSHSSRGDFTASEDDNVLVQGVSTDKYALGFFGLAYYEENAGKLKLIPIEDNDPSNGEGPISPSLETVKNGTYQPLSRPIFIYVKISSLSDTAVAKFVEYYIDNVAALAADVGYIPLTDDGYVLVKQRFQKRISGTAFKGSEVGVKIEELLKGQDGTAEPATSDTSATGVDTLPK